MALLTFMSTGNHTKKASEIWRARFGSGMTTFTVSLHLPTCCSALIWKITRVTDDLPSVPQATHWYLRVSPITACVKFFIECCLSNASRCNINHEKDMFFYDHNM